MKEKKTVVLTVRISPELKEKLQKIADSEYRPLALQVRKILEEYIKKVSQQDN